jgi:hypothetical protein
MYDKTVTLLIMLAMKISTQQQRHIRLIILRIIAPVGEQKPHVRVMTNNFNYANPKRGRPKSQLILQISHSVSMVMEGRRIHG